MRSASVGVVVLCVVISHVQTAVCLTHDDQHHALLQVIPLTDHRSKREDTHSGGMRRPVRQTQRRTSFEQKDMREITQKLNNLRSEKGSSDMKELVWDMDLEKMAQTWANSCADEMSPIKKRRNGAYSNIGQTYYGSTAFPTADDMIEHWLDQAMDYDYTNNTCAYCDDYKQIVWAKTYALGCGMKLCKDDPNFPEGFYRVFCNFGPGGSIPGVRPYQKGRACSECPNSFLHCISNLCARKAESSRASSGAPSLICCCLVTWILGMWTCYSSC